MNIVAFALVALVALEHVYFAVLEMFLWQRPTGRRIFATTEAFAKESAALAKNQGLYNLFLVAGLVWGLFAPEPFSTSLRTFFLACVVVAGAFGGMTVSRRILVVQAVPAAVGLAVVLAS